MKRILPAYGLWAIALTFLPAACQKETSRQKIDLQENSISETGTATPGSGTECGTPMMVDLWDGMVYGNVSVSNDADSVYITFAGSNGYLLQKASGVMGSYDHLQNVLGDDADNTVGPTPPDFVENFSPEVSSYTFSFGKDELDDTCFLLNVYAVLVQKDGEGNVTATKYVWAQSTDQITSYPFSTYFEYCLQDCPPPPPPPPPPPGDCGQLRTQTPGGWGAPPRGHNSGAYLHANFDAAFPAGLTIGCYPGDYYIMLTSAQAITDLLPTGGTAAALGMNYTDPASVQNVLAGHLIALTLSVTFDAYDPDFGQAGMHLGDMVISSGSFKGWTVNDFLAEANKVLGGCSTNYTPVQVLETADNINQNYVDGTTDNGYLVCP